jgi:isopentenyl-diphosphate delta-isomerase
MNEEQEVLDLVDDNDKIIGTILRTETYTKKIKNYRVVHGFLRNAVGQLWIPRRTPSKVLFPNGLDYSVAGHVESGESYEEALRREAAEELNLDLALAPWKLLGKRTPKDGAHCFQAVYELLAERSPEYNPKDFSGAEWMTPEEAVRKIHAGDLAKTDLASTIEQFYLGKD